MQKGKRIKEKRVYFAKIYDGIKRYFPIRNESEINRLLAEHFITEVQRERREFIKYIEWLPVRFSKNYRSSEYIKDCHNVRFYYTKWTREDVYGSKKSLARLRKYEKRERLEPFEQMEKRIKEEKNTKDYQDWGRNGF